jgi:hypothetical protein
MGKTVLESKFTEWKGLDRISATVHSMKHIWREISKDDFGIDGEIETHGNVLKVQSKSGASYVVEDTEAAFSSPVAKSDLETWNNSRYPVLYIVYHPDDDKLYCKEVRAYVKDTANVFQRPYKISFNKANDEFNNDYSLEVEKHAELSESRVSFNEKEELYSNLLPVRKLPLLFHATTEYIDVDEVRGETDAHLPPFCIYGDRLFSFADLRQNGCDLRPFCDGDVEVLRAAEWLRSDPDRQRDLVYMLNQTQGKLRHQLGLKYCKPYERTYFPRTNQTDKEFKVNWFSARTNKAAAAPRIVVKYYEYGLNKFWRHLACHMSFQRFGSDWFLRIVPKYLFTTDGESPCEGDLAGPYTTKLKAMEHNPQVLNHVLFWADFLAGGKPQITFKLDGHVVLEIDRRPLTGIANFAIPDDPAVFDEEPLSQQLLLFREELMEDDDEDRIS